MYLYVISAHNRTECHKAKLVPRNPVPNPLKRLI